MKYSQVRAILFDHDGTLVDSEKVHYELWAKTIAIDVTQFTPELFANNLVGVPTNGNAAFLIKTFNLNETVQTLVAKKARVTQLFLKESYFPAIGNVLKILEELHNLGIRMAIVSGSERYAVDRSVEGNKIAEYIEFITTGEEVPNNKPAPDVYFKAMEKMGLTAKQCLAVEDTEHGLDAAVKAGIECIAIPNEHTRHLNFTYACAKLDSLQSFLEHFKANL